MEYGRLGERQRRMRVPVLEILSSLLLLGAIILGMLELVEYSSTKDDLPTDLTIAGIPVGGLSEADVQIRLEEIYADQPVQLSYLGSPIVLDPVEVGGVVVRQATLHNFEYIADKAGIDHVSFGTDGLYGDHVGLHHLFAKSLATGDTRNQQADYEEVPFVKGLENPTESSVNILRWLVKKGYSDEDIGKVLGGNALRVLRQVWH